MIVAAAILEHGRGGMDGLEFVFDAGKLRVAKFAARRIDAAARYARVGEARRGIDIDRRVAPRRL